ncbi:MAG: PKD domain-containing protein, partial [Candidatus Acidifodinimicrobium sp.]
NGNNLLLYYPITNDIYSITLLNSVNLYVHINGIMPDLNWSVSIYSYGTLPADVNDFSFSTTNSTNISLQVLPMSYVISIKAPPGYLIQNVSSRGLPKYDSENLSRKFSFVPSGSQEFNISSDPVLNINFIPNAFKVTFSSNLNQGISWLTHWNLEKNVTWQVKIFHGTNPSAKIIYSNYLNNSTISNYTLIQNSTTQNMSFELFNGSYEYSVFSSTSLFITTDTEQNLAVSGLNQTIQVTFSGNYPKAVISFVPYKIPLDTAWVISGQNSSGGTGLSITNYSWTITGPVNYILSGQSNIVYFNQVGNYTISLTVSNQYGLKNTTSTSTDIIKFTVSSEISIAVSLKGVFSNSSADYQIEVKVPKNMSIASVEALIDNSTSMNIKFVNTSISGNYSYYFYLSSFDPSSYSYGSHFLNFSAYSTSGQFNYYHFSKTFGSTSKGSFNLMNFFGGPENFWAMIAAFIGVIITVASIFANSNITTFVIHMFITSFFLLLK